MGVHDHRGTDSTSQRVQLPNISGFWLEKPYHLECILEPETSNIGYLDPLGFKHVLLLLPLLFLLLLFLNIGRSSAFSTTGSSHRHTYFVSEGSTIQRVPVPNIQGLGPKNHTLSGYWD